MITKKGLFIRVEEHYCAGDEMRTCVEYIAPTIDDLRAWCGDNGMLIVPATPDRDMVRAGLKHWDGCMRADIVYMVMVKEAQKECS